MTTGARIGAIIGGYIAAGAIVSAMHPPTPGLAPITALRARVVRAVLWPLFFVGGRS